MQDITERVLSRSAVAELRRRFEPKVDRTPGLGPAGECHEWRGAARTSRGGRYGVLQVPNADGVGRGRLTTATHVAIFLATGKWPPRGMYAIHAPVICHNTLCVNLDHVRVGTPSENALHKRLDGTIGRRPARKVVAR